MQQRVQLYGEGVGDRRMLNGLECGCHIENGAKLRTLLIIATGVEVARRLDFGWMAGSEWGP
jgi:hypothetical protein